MNVTVHPRAVLALVLIVVLAAGLVSIVVVQSGYERAADKLHILQGAYTGSSRQLEIPADAKPSDYSPRTPLTQLVDGILGRQLEIRTDGGRRLVEQWVWVIGPGMRTAGISFKHAVLVEVIGGAGVVRLTRGGEASERSFSAGNSFLILPDQSATFENTSGIQIDIRATYLIDPALNRS